MIRELQELGTVFCSESLARHTTYRIGGVADYYVKPKSLSSLLKLIDLVQEKNVPYLILGKGSNVLVGDEPFHGVVISMDDNLSDFSFNGNILTAQAGCSLIALSFEAMKRSLSGLEFASGIPGSVGGGLYMNAGAYKSDLSAILQEVLVYRDQKTDWIPARELDYTYRHSAFQNHKDWVILAGRFCLKPARREDIAALMDSRKQRRLSSQPLDKPCAGSVFRNPDGLNAWKVVDELGFRGRRIGGARVSEIHSNFIVNENGRARARDVAELIRQIQQEAREKMGVDLITEVERLNWHEK